MNSLSETETTPIYGNPKGILFKKFPLIKPVPRKSL